METRRCISCMREITEINCPHCGYPMVNPNDPHQLPVGTRLAQRLL